MSSLQIFTLIVCLSYGIAHASSYGSSFNYANNYPYTGNYVGAGTGSFITSNSGSQYNNGYGGYSNGYNGGYEKGYSGYGQSVYNNVILPHPYPVPIPSGNSPGSRLVVLDQGSNQNSGLFGFGNGGIFSFVIMIVILQYIIQAFNQNQAQG